MILGLDQRATVYTPDSDGAWTVQAKANLKCRLTHSALSAASVGEYREEGTGQYVLLWEPDYVMPEDAQLLIDSERWNVVEGTARALRGPLGNMVYRRCLVVRAD